MLQTLWTKWRFLRGMYILVVGSETKNKLLIISNLIFLVIFFNVFLVLVYFLSVIYLEELGRTIYPSCFWFHLPGR
jgi:hypothetical protein